MEPEEIAKTFGEMVFEIGQHAVFKEGGLVHPMYFFARFEEEHEVKRRMALQKLKSEEAEDEPQLVYAALPTLGLYNKFFTQEPVQERIREICMRIGVVAIALVGEAMAAEYPTKEADQSSPDFVAPKDMEDSKRVLSVGVMLPDGRSGLMIGDIETKQGMSYAHKGQWHFGENVGLSMLRPWDSC